MFGFWFQKQSGGSGTVYRYYSDHGIKVTEDTNRVNVSTDRTRIPVVAGVNRVAVCLSADEIEAMGSSETIRIRARHERIGGNE